MGYPQRFYETGNIYHLTASCHDRTFLLKAAYYRQIFVNVLFFAGLSFKNYRHMLVSVTPGFP